MHLTDAEQKSLGSTAMGRESIPFAEQAAQLFANFPQILPRTVTDEMIAAYPGQLQSFRDADDLSVAAATIVAQLSGNKLATGNTVMGMARGGYKNGQDDRGKTPGVKPIIDVMRERFPNGPKPADVPTPPPAM
ncbi:hypothetical protein [Hymenobacter terricola]|uniref:hypothetical protein n=1 Tax=Hymenobacter terricola TaxID=2819236 RepID=UPI001B301777|nr:hypothetical protein [Hymenobacter terricola]